MQFIPPNSKMLSFNYWSVMGTTYITCLNSVFRFITVVKLCENLIFSGIGNVSTKLRSIGENSC